MDHGGKFKEESRHPSVLLRSNAGRLGGPVEKANQYREHAKDCRALARTARTPEHRQMLIIMAETWESLAADRERLLAKRAKDGGVADSSRRG